MDTKHLRNSKKPWNMDSYYLQSEELLSLFLFTIVEVTSMEKNVFKLLF